MLSGRTIGTDSDEMDKSVNSQGHSVLISGAELAARVDERYTTIDYWSKMGLLEFVRRGNKRLYEPESACDRCGTIRQRQNEGLNLEAIKREFNQADGRRR